MMRNVYKAILLAAFVLVWESATADAQKRNPDFYNGFIGRWEGDFRPVPSQVFSPRPPDAPAPNTENPPVTQMAFSISASSVQVYTRPVNGTWHEIKSGNWRMLTGLTNAVVFSITSGEDADGGWVETWNYTITHKERDSLQVVMTRAVNNFNKPSDYLEKTNEGVSPGRFFRILYGEMTRPDTTGK